MAVLISRCCKIMASLLNKSQVQLLCVAAIQHCDSRAHVQLSISFNYTDDFSYRKLSYFLPFWPSFQSIHTALNFCVNLGQKPLDRQVSPWHFIHIFQSICIFTKKWHTTGMHWCSSFFRIPHWFCQDIQYVFSYFMIWLVFVGDVTRALIG